MWWTIFQIWESCDHISGVLPAKWATKGKEMSQVDFLVKLHLLINVVSFVLLRHGWEHGCKWNRRFRRTDEKVESVMNLPKEEWLYFGCLLISLLIPSDMALVDIVENIIWCTYTFCIEGVLSDIIRRLCDICTNQHLHLDLRHVTGVNLKKVNKLVLPIKYGLDPTLSKYQLLTLRLFCSKR